MTDVDDKSEDPWNDIKDVLEIDSFRDLDVLYKTRTRTYTAEEWKKFSRYDQYALFQLYPLIEVQDENGLVYRLTHPQDYLHQEVNIAKKRSHHE